MKRILLAIVALAALACSPAMSQPGQFPALIGQKGDTLPTNCTVGALFFKTNATAGVNVYGCTAANTWTLQGDGGGTGTVTSVGWTGGIVSVATPTTTPAFTIAGTSGGIPYFSGATTWASSAALAANAIVIGGGAGAAPATTTTGTGILTWIGTPSSANLASALTDETGSGAAVFGTSPTIASPTITGTAVTFTSGTSRTLANASEIVVCTSTCTVTPPASATAGMQFCVQNDDNVSTVITLAAVSGVQYESTARTSYGTANHTMTSGGAVKDQICMVAVSATKWNVWSSVGTWTNN